MDLSISEEQSAIRDVISRFIENEYDFEKRMSIAEGDSAFDSDVYNFFVEQGFTAIPFSEEDGGLNGGPVETMLIMKEIGRGLVLEPYLENVILAGGVLKRLATDDQKSKWLSNIINGELQSTLAFTEPQSRFNLNDVATVAKENGDKVIINGKKSFVLNGKEADIIIVPARTSGSQTETEGISLFVVESNLPGISKNNYKSVDGHSASEITFKNVEVNKDNLLGEIGKGYQTLESTIDDATLAVCAEATGIMNPYTIKQ